MATTATTCPHGLEARTCLICSTLGLSQGGTAIPVGRPDVLVTTRPARRRGVGVVGGLVLLLGALVALWLVLGLLWSLLRGAELVLTGALCGYVGYRVGVFVGRRSTR